jgi:leucyl-tRNA synthetase
MAAPDTTASAPQHDPGTYDFAALEARWQKHWETHETFAAPALPEPGQRKFYVLDMFPYPSGVGLHVGHPLGYIATDIVARYRRMKGDAVLHPIGFDAFGLPAEQFALEHNVHPRITTERNIETMLGQLKRLGLSYDWSRVFATTDPDYYRWTQWIFLQLYQSYVDPRVGKAQPVEALRTALWEGDVHLSEDETVVFQKGKPIAWRRLGKERQEEVLGEHRLAYLAEVPVNWCPGLGTVLANEEVTNEGRSERGNYPVFKRPLKQWMLRITDYAERLLKDLDLVEWPEKVKAMQTHWIGRSEGARVDFVVDPHETNAGGQTISVFTTRPDTLFGATFMVLAPEHPLVDAITSLEQRETVAAYRKEAAARSEIDRTGQDKPKSGVDTGATALNPATGEHVPIYIADYVLMGYGTGAIMAVPGQDERDWAFAEAHDLPIVRTVKPPKDFDGKAYTGEGRAINSGFLDGLGVAEAKRRMIAWLETEGRGEGTVTYKLRDWLFSRQRYWGEPFPILHELDSDGQPTGRVVPVDESELPVTLPPMDDFQPTASEDPEAPPQPPLGRADESWQIVEIGGTRYRRELNTMPNWAGSCWYYLRFIDPHNDEALVGAEREAAWMEGGVDLYVGGVEHAVLHLLYARFWHKVLFDLGHVSTPEPFGTLFNQGYIQAYAYRDERGIAVDASEVVDQDGRPATEVQDQPGREFSLGGEPVTQEYGKMGKSLKNAVNPDLVAEQYGCDTLRVYEMYLGPLDQSKPWNTRDIIGAHRFLKRVWRNFVAEDGGLSVTDEAPSDELLRLTHKTIQGVGEDMERLGFNTALAKLIELNNALVGLSVTPREVAEPMARLLAPFAPHLAEELWQRLGREGSIAYAPWPEAEEQYLVENTITLAVQVMGKRRGEITVAADADKVTVLAAAKAEANVARFLEGKTIRKEIYVPRRIVNIVAN